MRRQRGQFSGLYQAQLVSIRLMGQVNSNGNTMSDNVTLFPNILQPAAALKAYGADRRQVLGEPRTALEA